MKTVTVMMCPGLDSSHNISFCRYIDKRKKERKNMAVSVLEFSISDIN